MCLVQAHDLEKKAEALTGKASTIKKAALKVCTAMDALVIEQAALSEALDSFCGGQDEESLRIGCPLLRRFVTFFDEVREGQGALSGALRAILVESFEDQLVGNHLQAIKDQRRALAKAEGSSDSSKIKFRLYPRAQDSPQVPFLMMQYNTACLCLFTVMCARIAQA